MSKNKETKIDSYVIRVSRDVLKEIEKRSTGWRESVDSILRREFKLPKKERK